MPATGMSLIRVLGAIALAAVGFGLIVAGAWALGYGHDLHAPRMVGTLGVLVVAMLLTLWPGRPAPRRLLVCVTGLLLGVAAWFVIPAGLAGRSLLSAGTERELIAVWLRKVLPADVSALPQLRERAAVLAADYPALAAGLGEGVNEKIEKAIEARVAELRDLSATDTVGFARGAASRRSVVTLFPESRARLVEAEEEWASRWAGFTAVGYTHSDMSPRHVREGCRECEQQLREMPSLDDSATRLLEARRVFFRAAHESAVGEIRALHEAERFERAFGIAADHAIKWSATATLLGADAETELSDFRERCRGLVPPDGGPETIPPPRPIETAPVPRPK